MASRTEVGRAAELASVETGERKPVDGTLTFTLELPRQGVAAYRIEW